MDLTRFEELLRLWQDGDAGADELRELETLLKSDPLYRKELVGAVLLEAGLHRRYAAASAATVGAPAPLVRRHRWEAVAAILVLAISLLAVGRLLTRGETPGPRLLGGEVWTAGAPVHELRGGQSFEVRGLAPATLSLADGTRIILDAGSAGTLPSADVDFLLIRGSGSFQAHTFFRMATPAGTLSSSDGQFWILLRPSTRKQAGRKPELVVEGARGSVDVDAWDTKASVAAGGRRVFGPAAPGGDYSRLLDRATLTLSAAVARAAAAGSGIPVHAELEDEDGRVAFSVGLAAGAKVRELEIDPKSGRVLNDETEDEDRSPVAAAVTLPLQAIIDKVLESVPGRAVEAEFELKGGRLKAEIKVFGPDGLREIKADAATGEILKSERNKGD